jgi:prophage regulatory protein
MKPDRNVENILPPDGFVRLSTLLKCIPFSRSTLYAKVKNGSFPAPCKLSERIVAWAVEDIRAFIELKGGTRP